MSGAPPYIYDSVERVEGIRLAWRGDVDEARRIFARLLSLADERGEAFSYQALRLQLCELDLRVGDWEDASRLLGDAEPSRDEQLALGSEYERCHAVLAAGRGLRSETDRWAAEAIAGAEQNGVLWDLLEAKRARGMAALLAHEPARAVEDLAAVWAHTEREGVDDPGAFPVAPDLVEALLELGRDGEARAVTDRLTELSEAQQHPWGLVTATRCDSLVRLVSPSHDEEAAASLAQAAAAYEQLGLRFDAPRSLLSLGRAQRRHRKWGAARHSLEHAAAGFDTIGSPGWAEEARSELARVGARRPGQAGELTPTERRVVELAADGLSNKEIAGALVVTVNTVEVHLSHAYAKLGVHSRTQLARRLAGEV
jgi:DNA-binding NarL/FixJ family response regulator